MRILVLANADLYRPRGGSQLYCYNRWRRIARNHRLTVLLTDTVPHEPDPAFDPPESWCEKVYTVPDRPASFGLRLERKLRRCMPWRSSQMGQWHNREAKFLAHRLLREERFDLLHVEGFSMWWLLPRRLDLPVSYTATDIVSRFAENNPQPGDPWMKNFFAARRHAQLRRMEPPTWQRANLITTITTVERDWIAKEAPGVPVVVIPNGIDKEYFAPSDEAPARPPELCFTGIMLYRPNIDAMLYFCHEVLPLIRAEVPEVRLNIVGREPAPEVQRLADIPGVTVTGSVPDVRPYLRRASVVVAPVRLGAGMRGKHLEAMAMRKPVVATTFCVEGTACTHGKDILLGDDPKSFAEHTLRLLRDRSYADAIAQAGMELVHREYDWDINAARMEEHLVQCVADYRARQK